VKKILYLRRAAAAVARRHEDLNDHDQLRDDPVMGVLLSKVQRNEDEPSPLAWV
jgi:hypothetical protein